MPDAHQLKREELMVDLVGETGRSTGQDTVLAAHVAPGMLHRAFSVMLLDTQGRVLLQQRSQSKIRFAGIWGPSCCGHHIPGSDLTEVASRRIEEELGLTGVSLSVVGTTRYTITECGNGQVEREYNHVMLGTIDADPKPDQAEVQAVRWVSPDELRQEMAADYSKFGQWLRPVLDVVLDHWKSAKDASDYTNDIQLPESISAATGETTRSRHEEECFRYWNTKRTDTVNLAAASDALVHSHYSVVDFDRSLLTLPPSEARDEAILHELHRLENAQVDEFIDRFAPVDPDARVMDAGCGRGGTALRLNQRHGCFIDGVDFSPYRLDFAHTVAKQRGVEDRVRFHHRNMVATGFDSDTFDLVYENEAAEHLEDYTEFITEAARVLKPGGKLAVAVWCANDPISQKGWEVAQINAHYFVNIPTRHSLIRGMMDNHLVPLRVDDLTQEAIPYWELRDISSHRTGVEEPFLSAYRARRMNYVFIVAEYQPAE